jgi:hypothetical protein
VIYRANKPPSNAPGTDWVYQELQRIQQALDVFEAKTVQLQQFTDTNQFPDKPVLGELLNYQGALYQYTDQGWLELATIPAATAGLAGLPDEITITDATATDLTNYTDSWNYGGAFTVNELGGDLVAERECCLLVHGELTCRTSGNPNRQVELWLVAGVDRVRLGVQSLSQREQLMVHGTRMVTLAEGEQLALAVQLDGAGSMLVEEPTARLSVMAWHVAPPLSGPPLGPAPPQVPL